MKGKRSFDSFSFVVKISEDPAGFIDGPNLYAYARMNPIMFLDPWGLCGENGDRPFIPLYIVPNTISNIDPNLLTTATIPREPSTLSTISLGLGMMGVGVGVIGSFSDWYRYGDTVVSNQLVNGPGSSGATVVKGIKGGGTNPNTGFNLPFHYHIHKYNWYKPWMWFKNTPIL